MPVTFIRPTLSPVAGFEIGARSAMIGIRPSIRSSSESWARRSSRVPVEKYGVLPVRPTESPAAEVRVSSISPSPLVTSFRIEWLIVSPVPRAEEIISVLSIRPTTMSEVCAGLLGMLRRPIFRTMRFSRASRPTAPTISAKPTATPTTIRLVSTPNISSIVSSNPSVWSQDEPRT